MNKVEELQSQIDELNAQGDELREQIKALKRERDRILGEESAKAKWDALSDAEKAALAQLVSLSGTSVTQ